MPSCIGIALYLGFGRLKKINTLTPLGLNPLTPLGSATGPNYSAGLGSLHRINLRAPQTARGCWGPILPRVPTNKGC